MELLVFLPGSCHGRKTSATAPRGVQTVVRVESALRDRHNSDILDRDRAERQLMRKRICAADALDVTVGTLDRHVLGLRIGLRPETREVGDFLTRELSCHGTFLQFINRTHGAPCMYVQFNILHYYIDKVNFCINTLFNKIETSPFGGLYSLWEVYKTPYCIRSFR